MEWETWCSLCANIDTNHAVSETPIEVIGAIYKHFDVVHQGEQLKICPECREFLGTFVLFEEKCQKVQSIFEQISSNHLINSKQLYDMRIDAGLDSGGIMMETDDEIMNFREDIECPSFESHSIGEMEDDALPYDTEHVKLEYEQTESSIIMEQNTPDDDSSTRKLRTRAKTKTAPEFIKKERKDRSTLVTPAKNKNTKCKKTQQNADLDDTPSNDQSETMKKKRQRAECLDLKCKLCDAEVFENHRLYVKHMRELHTGETKIFNCLKCSSNSFETWSGFTRHEKVHLPDDQQQLVSCSYCPKKFRCPSNAEKHVRTMHKKDDMTGRVICDQCGKLLLSLSALNAHIVSHSDDRPHYCDQCSKTFKSKQMLKRHLETHSTKKEVCSLCALQFSSSITLRRHMVVHSNHKPFKCKHPECGKAFKRSKALKNHLLLHTGLKPYSCIFCVSYTCSNGGNFRSHMKKYHADELAKLEASGKTLPAVVMPKLNELQPNYH